MHDDDDDKCIMTMMMMMMTMMMVMLVMTMVVVVVMVICLHSSYACHAASQEMESSVEEILQDDTLVSEEGSLRLQMNRVSNGDEDKAAAFTKLVRSLIVNKIDFCLKEWRQLQSSDDISALEGNLRAMASALSALYGLGPPSSLGSKDELPALPPAAGAVDGAAAAPEAGASPAANSSKTQSSPAEALQKADRGAAEGREAGKGDETAGPSVDASAAPEGQGTGVSVPDGAASAAPAPTST